MAKNGFRSMNCNKSAFLPPFMEKFITIPLGWGLHTPMLLYFHIVALPVWVAPGAHHGEWGLGGMHIAFQAFGTFLHFSPTHYIVRSHIKLDMLDSFKAPKLYLLLSIHLLCAMVHYHDESKRITLYIHSYNYYYSIGHLENVSDCLVQRG